MGCSGSSQVKNVENPEGENKEDILQSAPPNAFSSDAGKILAERVDRGEKFLEGLLKFLQTRVELESFYVKKLEEWENTQKNNMSRQEGANKELIDLFKALTKEAEAQRVEHEKVVQRLNSEITDLKQWKSEMYQKKGVFSNGTKQGEEIQKALENAKAPWQKSVHQAILLRENYYSLCREVIECEASALAETAKHSKDSQQVKALQLKTASKTEERDQAESDYKNFLEKLPEQFPDVQTAIVEVLEKLKEIEKRRIDQVKLVCERYIKAVDTTDISSMETTINGIQQLIKDTELNGQLSTLIEDATSNKPDIPQFESFNPK